MDLLFPIGLLMCLLLELGPLFIPSSSGTAFKEYTLKGMSHISSYCHLTHQRKSTLFSHSDQLYITVHLLSLPLIVMINLMA